MGKPVILDDELQALVDLVGARRAPHAPVQAPVQAQPQRLVGLLVLLGATGQPSFPRAVRLQAPVHVQLGRV